MNRTGVYSTLALGVWLAVAVGSGCAGDDAKVAVNDGGAGGEGGDASASGAASSGGSAGGSALAGSDTGGMSDGGMSDGGVSGEGGNAIGGSEPGSGAGDTSTGLGGGAAGAGAGGGGSGTNEAGTGSIDQAAPVPRACISCGIEFCLAERGACQNDPACVSCRDENYHTLACAQNTNFTTWISCVCAIGCTTSCGALCGD